MTAFIFYDTETTGTQIDKDRVVEIAAYNGKTEETFVSYINPEIPIPKDASDIHGITTEMVVSSPLFPEVFEKFRAFCGSQAVLVAHNNDHFDQPLLEKECLRHGIAFLNCEFIDSLKWAQKYRPDLPKHNLQYLRQVYGFEENRAHRALDDVMILYQVFSALIGDLEPEQVIALIKETPHLKSFKMPFGKYRGKLLTEVPDSYITWLESQDLIDKPENKAIKAAIDALKQSV